MGSSDPALLTEARIPLSASQREVWLDQRAWPESAHLNIGGGAFLRGQFDLAIFRESLRRLVAETESLRLAPLPDGTQRLLADAPIDLEMVDLSSAADPIAAIRAWWNSRMAEPFALNGSPPWRFALLRGGPELHGLTIRFHHAIMDGWGTALIMQRWSEIHNAIAKRSEVAPTASASYASFVAESNAYLQSPAYERDAIYWSQKLTSLPERLFDPKSAGHELRSLPSAHLSTYRIPRQIYDEMLTSARSIGVTPFVLFLAAIAIYFSRTRHRNELVIGIPSLNRSKRHRETPGMYAGVFPLPVTITTQSDVIALLREINHGLRDSLRHASYPLSEIGRQLEIVRQGRNGIFDVLISFERQDYQVSFENAALVDSRQLFSGISRYPLGVTVCEFNDDQDVELVLEGSAAIFSDGDMELLGHRLWHLVKSITNRPASKIGDIDVLPPEELWAVVHGFHNDVAHHDSLPTFIAQFEHQAALRPEATALTWDYGSMDYATLDRRASTLAKRLIAAGVTPKAIVAFAIPRSPDMMIGLLAIAKTGAAFLPIDIDAPPSRTREILEQSRASALLIQDEFSPRFEAQAVRKIIVNISSPVDEGLVINAFAPSTNDLAYVIFTSGSTGTPKGVAVSHATLSRRLAWLSKTYAVEWHDRSAQATQITFDPALIEALLPLIHGACVALPPPGRLRPESLATFAVAHGVTIMAFVPSTLSSFLDGVRNRKGLRLRVACCGGEVLSPDLAARFIGETKARLFNVYGPTEASIFATAHECGTDPTTSQLPIGRPIDDTRIYVLDEAMRPLPFGEQGEIYIGGRTLADGYLNRPELDVSAFLPDPFVPGQRIYRSGDCGWIGSDDNLYFSGRRDRQVKLRGYRIELGEVEAALSGITGVDQAAAKIVGESTGRQIHAWIASETSIDREAVHRQLRMRLPDYMLPSRIELLPSLPVTSAGKIDYTALLSDCDAIEGPRPAHRPTKELERQLLQLWEETLQQAPLGIRDDFFELGGDSLAAIGILAGIDRLTGQKVSLYALTEHPTVERLAAALTSQTSTAKLMVRLTRQRTSGTPLYLAASGHGDLMRFQNLAKALGDEFDVHMLQPPTGTAVSGIDELARLYADRISMEHAPPAYIAGFSVAGLSALETARQLLHQGVSVRGLVLIDTVFPSKIIGGKRFWNSFAWLVRNLHVQDLSMNGRRLEAMFNDPGLKLQVAALGGYIPAPFDGQSLLIKSTGLAGWERWLFRPWRHHFDNQLKEAVIQGLHGSMFESPSVERLAELLKEHFADDTRPSRNQTSGAA